MHEHIDQDKQKENLLRRLLLFVEEGKHEQTTAITMLQTSSILRQKASLYEKPQERNSRRLLSGKEAGRLLANTTIKA